jgi:predicted TIM-barrel fold metal-dependent hydrolase
LIPSSDAEVPAFTEALGLPGLADLHLHFLPPSVQTKVWAFFDRATVEYGAEWPIHYRLPADERLAVLRDLGVRHFAPLVYPHKPDMAVWLNEWVGDFAAATPEAVPTATFFPELGVDSYVADAVERGVRCVKSHVQVGGYDPRDPLLEPVWGLLAEAGVPVVIHCGHGPVPGKFTGLDVFEDVLRRHPRLVVVLAHAGMPEFSLALDLVERYPNVYLDTTMVGVPFKGADEMLPADWAARLAGITGRVALGTDFPSIPYDYATQLRAIASWADADDRLGEAFLRAVLWDTPRRLLALA